MRTVYWLLLWILMAGMPAYGAEETQKLPASFVELANKHQKLVTAFTYETGQPYRQYREQFFNEADFIRQCAPSDTQIVKPLTIYMVITKDGHVSQLEIYPQTETALCVSKLMQTHVFTAPPFEFLGEIVLNFNPVAGDILVGPPFAGPRVSSGESPCKEITRLSGSDKVIGSGVFSSYTLYGCGEGGAQRYVIWRLGNQNRLEGELILPAKLLKPHIKPHPKEHAENLYLFNMVRCVLRKDVKNAKNNSWELINKSDIWALYGLEKFEMPVIARTFYAWRGDTNSLKLAPVPIAELAMCDEEIDNED